MLTRVYNWVFRRYVSRDWGSSATITDRTDLPAYLPTFGDVLDGQNLRREW